jgi:methylmalonyl-CoA/ethylmalonyl-CoA epimerase
MIFLNHIGIAVQDVVLMRRFFALIGFEVAHTEAVPEQGVVTHFLPLPNELPGSPKKSVTTNLEMLEVTDPAGTVAKFLEKRGPGVHHLSFEVGRGELDPLCAKLRAENIQLIYPQAKFGAHEMRVNFVHPKSTGGLLVELMERADTKPGSR